MANNSDIQDETIPYDDNNIFARILRNELPYDKVYEDEYVLAFRDINPQASAHIVMIPKGCYVSVDDFTAKASTEEIAGFMRAISKIAASLGLSKAGYRCLTNCGIHGGQEIFHFHMHLVGGQQLGPMLTPRT